MVTCSPLDSEGVIMQLIAIERWSTGDDSHVTELSVRFKYDKDVSIGSVLCNPTLLCPRVPAFRCNDAAVSAISLADMPCRRFVRSFVLAADFCRSLPEFWELQSSERTILLSRSFLQLTLLSNFFYSYYAFPGCSGDASLQIVLGTRISASTLPAFGKIADTLQLLLRYGAQCVLPALQDLRIKLEEFVLLKAIALFSVSLGFSDATVKVMNTACNRYSRVLYERCREMTGTALAASARFMQLQHVSRCTMLCANKIFPQVGKHVLLDEGGLECALAKEFVRNF